MKKIISLFIVTILFLVACSSNNDSSTAVTNKCLADGLDLKVDSTAEALLIEKSNPIGSLDGKEFTKDMMDEVQYGGRYTIGDEDFYITYELCNTDTNEASYIDEYLYNETKYMDETPNSILGSYTDFFSSTEEKEEFEVGNYSVNTFKRAIDSDKWEYVGSREFLVVE